MFFLSRVICDLLVLVWQRALRPACSSMAGPDTLLRTLLRLQLPGEHAIPCLAAANRDRGDTSIGFQAVRGVMPRDGEASKLRRRAEFVAGIFLVTDCIQFAFLTIFGVIYVEEFDISLFTTVAPAST